MPGIYREYPIIDKNNIPLWPGKYPTTEDIEEQKRKIMDERAWLREYCLKIVAADGQLIKPEWIHTYFKLPETSEDSFSHAAFAVDLAITQGLNSDYTAIVSAHIFHDANDKITIYILPNLINERVDFPTMVETVKMFKRTLLPSHRVETYVESNGFQVSLVQQLNNEGYDDINSVKVSANKRIRLQNTTHLLKNGSILFPQHGCEQLITQLVGFGKEKHDDLADAFSLLVNQIMVNEKPTPGIFVIEY